MIGKSTSLIHTDNICVLCIVSYLIYILYSFLYMTPDPNKCSEWKNEKIRHTYMHTIYRTCCTNTTLAHTNTHRFSSEPLNLFQSFWGQFREERLAHSCLNGLSRWHCVCVSTWFTSKPHHLIRHVTPGTRLKWISAFVLPCITFLTKTKHNDF